MKFQSENLPSCTIKVNGKIKKAIDQYKRKKVVMRQLMSDFLAVKSKEDLLAKAENPWAYFYKGMEGHEIESGVSVLETAFIYAAMEIKDQEPSDVINAAYYANKLRNDSDFEMGYLLPLFAEMVPDRLEDILVVNPSPDMICAINDAFVGLCYYVVTDETIASLYKLQFPYGEFLSFEQMCSADIEVDAVLITNRDQKLSQARILLGCLSKCKDNARVLGLVPTAWFDSMDSGAGYVVLQNGFGIKQMLLVDKKCTVSTPRKKAIIVLEKGVTDNIEVSSSSYDPPSREFTVNDHIVSVDHEAYLKSDKTILSLWKEALKPSEDTAEPKYAKAEEYRFSKEISLFYKIYSGRKNKFAGVAYYKEIKDAKNKIWGKKISADIEKGLRADSREQVVASLEGIAFDEAIYPVIRGDIEKNYIYTKNSVTLKTLWFYCWNYVESLKEYDHEYVCKLMECEGVASIIPGIHSGQELLAAVAEGLKTDLDDIPYKTIDQLEKIFKSAVKHKLLLFDPLEAYVADYTSRATERQQDVRNVLMKKHFTAEEEEKIFMDIIKNKRVPKHHQFSCTEKSILLGVAIRMFTGMSIRETAALNWNDFKRIGGSDDYQFTITKFVDANGNIISHVARENWKRFRIVPVPRTLSYLLKMRKKYLIEQGIREGSLGEYPIVLQEECLTDMKNEKVIKHCRPSKISNISNEIIKKLDIPENMLILPDEKNDLATDFNRYHGDIFLSNFRHKANHTAYLTMGEINYMIGIDAPDTFSRHYCDFTNDLLQEGMIQKLSRWEVKYERIVTDTRLRCPSCGSEKGNATIKAGPYHEGIATLDMLVDNKTDQDATVTIQSTHGADVSKILY